MFNYLKGIWRKIMEWDIQEYMTPDYLKDSTGKPSEFDKAAIPTTAMIKAATTGLELRAYYGKGGENLVVLALAQKIAGSEFITFEEIKALKSHYNKRSRYASAAENTMGYINFMLLGGHPTKIFLETGYSVEAGMLAVSGLNPKNE